LYQHLTCISKKLDISTPKRRRGCLYLPQNTLNDAKKWSFHHIWPQHEIWPFNPRIRNGHPCPKAETLAKYVQKYDRVIASWKVVFTIYDSIMTLTFWPTIWCIRPCPTVHQRTASVNVSPVILKLSTTTSKMHTHTHALKNNQETMPMSVRELWAELVWTTHMLELLDKPRSYTLITQEISSNHTLLTGSCICTCVGYTTDYACQCCKQDQNLESKTKYQNNQKPKTIQTNTDAYRTEQYWH